MRKSKHTVGSIERARTRRFWSPPWLCAAAIVSVTLLGGSPLAAIDEYSLEDRGKQLALRHCSNCHDTGQGQTALYHPDTPTFEELAQRQLTKEALTHALLAREHPAMPRLLFLPSQVEEIKAYLDSLSSGSP